MEKREPSYTVGGNVNWYSYCGKQYGESSKMKNRAAIWPSNPTPGHIPAENHDLKRYMHPNFTAALFMVAKTWKQSKCSLLDEWVKKIWYIYTVEHYSATKKEQDNAICSNMDGPRYYHSKWSKSEENTWYHLYLQDRYLNHCYTWE